MSTTSTDPTISAEQLLSGDRPTIVYDGECPFCARYARLLRLRDSVGDVRLVDARQLPDNVLESLRALYDLDRGMIFANGGRVHHGADAVNVLALLSSRHGWFNRLNARLFSSPVVSTALYPLLRLGRSAALRLKGSDPLHPSR